MAIELTVPSWENSSIDICLDRKLFDLKYADDYIVVIDDTSKLLCLNVRLSDIVVICKMRFRSSKCEMLLQDWSGSNLKFVLAVKQLITTDTFGPSCNCISPGDSKSEEVFLCIQKSRLLFSNFEQPRVGVITAYWPNIESTRQRSAQHCSAAVNHTCWKPMWGKFWFLNIVVLIGRVLRKNCVGKSSVTPKSLHPLAQSLQQPLSRIRLK